MGATLAGKRKGQIGDQRSCVCLSLLTLDPKEEGSRSALAQAVQSETLIMAAMGTLDTLQHEALIGHNDPRGRITEQWLAFECPRHFSDPGIGGHKTLKIDVHVLLDVIGL